MNPRSPAPAVLEKSFLMRWIFALALAGLGSLRAEWLPVEPPLRESVGPGVTFIQRDVREGDRTVRVEGVLARARDVRFVVCDNPESQTLATTMQKAGALAGVNGGYFHPDRTPLGLVIVDGHRLHGYERAKLLSGIFLVTKSGPRLVRAAKYQPNAADREALQAGPFLLEDGQPPAGLNATRAARRTVVATDGAGCWALLTISPVTLADAGTLLASSSAWLGRPLTTALNLDGGSSTALWVGEPPVSRPEFGTVRNFLAIFPRP